MASRGRRPKAQELKGSDRRSRLPRVPAWEAWSGRAGTLTSQGGRSGRLAAEFSDACGGTEVLRASLGDAWSETLVILTSEFGRRIDPNGTGGTDHGAADSGSSWAGPSAGAECTPQSCQTRAGGLRWTRLPCTVHPMQLWASVLTQHWGVRGEELSEILTAEALGDSLDIKLR